MVTALRPRPFLDNLCMNPVADIDELYQWAAKFMQVEELREFKSQVRSKNNISKRNDQDQNLQKSREGPCGPIFVRYTPLNTDRARILEEALSVSFSRGLYSL